MRQMDFAPFRRSAIGFDRLFDLLETNARQGSAENYPPFNLERVADDRYRITLAVAGFRSDEIEITAHQNQLIVIGKKAENDDNRGRYLHFGIAARSFERRFELADFIRVDSADLADGLLTVELVREVPEAMKPRRIAIGAGDAPATIEQKGEQQDEQRDAA